MVVSSRGFDRVNHVYWPFISRTFLQWQIYDALMQAVAFWGLYNLPDPSTLKAFSLSKTPPKCLSPFCHIPPLKTCLPLRHPNPLPKTSRKQLKQAPCLGVIPLLPGRPPPPFLSSSGQTQNQIESRLHVWYRNKRRNIDFPLRFPHFRSFFFLSLIFFKSRVTRLNKS